MAETIISKRCTKCKEIKNLTEFGKDQNRKDGCYPLCRVCNRKRLNKHKRTEKGKAGIKHYQQGEKFKATQKRYRQSEKGKIARQKGLHRFYTRHPENLKAKTAVMHAIESGKLPRPDSLQCHYCPAQAKQYHHHKGYKPKHWLDVVPVCVKCHSRLPI